MSYGSGPHLLDKVGSGATMCLTAPCGPPASSIKKSLAGLPVQLGTHIPNARVHISNAHDVRAIMGLQDVRAGNALNACKACKLVATM
jgi:hypothetical protein